MDKSKAYEWALDELKAAKKYADEQNMTVQGGGGPGGPKKGKKGGGGTKTKKKKQADGGAVLKALLLKPSSGVYHYGPSLIEHCVLHAGLDPLLKLTSENLSSTLAAATWEGLLTSLRDEGARVVRNLESGKGGGGGYILYQPKPKQNGNDVAAAAPASALPPDQHADKLLQEFQPHLLLQHDSRPRLPYSTFAEAVDEFYSRLESQRRTHRAEAAERTASDRLEKIRRDQSRRVEALGRDSERLSADARLVEAHAADVDRALGVIRSALENGMDWAQLNALVEVERVNENPIALLIRSLDLDEDRVVLGLPDIEDDVGDGDDRDAGGDDDEEEEGEEKMERPPRIRLVTVSTLESAHGNARSMFAKYRASKTKAAKTLEASTTALKAAEAKAQKQLQEARTRKNAATRIAPQRRAHWFEKFAWFVTSDDYLVLAGRDAQQNEILVKRFLRPGDAYLHAEVHGAATCVLRAKRRRREVDGKTEVLPLSDQALREAGSFTICRSSAWASKMVTSAYWVESHQVSKTAPTGEYLTTGSFMIRGRKNFLPPCVLEMGMAVLFRLGDEESVARHKNERRDFALLERESSRAEGEAMANDGGASVEPVRKGLESAALDDNKDDDDGGGTQGKVAAAGERSDPSVSVASEPTCVSPDDDVAKDEGEPANIDDGSGDTIDEKEGIAKSCVAADDDRPELDQEQGGARPSEADESNEYTADAQADSPPKGVTFEEPKRSNGPPPTPVQKKKQIEPTRGKRSKNKRAKKKYMEQDDEDRTLALQALHGGERVKKKDKKKGTGRGSARGQLKDNQSETQREAAAATAALLVRDSSEVVNKLPENVRVALGKCVTVAVGTGPTTADDGDGNNGSTYEVRWNKFDAEVLEQLRDMESTEAQVAAAMRLYDLSSSTRIDNFSASLAGIIRAIKKHGVASMGKSASDGGGGGGGNNKQRKTKAEKHAEKEAWREILAEDGILENDGDEREESTGGPVDDTAELCKLTGKPTPEDAVLYAVPVCAPYQVLSQYKYRVKLTPGNLKRGKASKQCVEMFMRGGGSDGNSGDNKKKGGAGAGGVEGGDAAKQRDRELIKVVNDNEWVQAMIGDVRLSAAGASKVVKKHKANQKKKGGGGRGGGKK